MRAKAKAQEIGNLKEEARVCGDLGEQYTEEGERSRARKIYLFTFIDHHI